MADARLSLAQAGPLSTNRARIRALIGDRRGTVVALSICSILSGFAEAGILASIAQVATTLVNHSRSVSVHVGFANIDTSRSTILMFAFGLAVFRLLLQAPLAVLPARIASHVQAGLRRNLFEAFSNAAWATQSSDREGHLQETLTSQVIQATAGAIQTTMLITAAFSFLVLMLSSVILNAVAAGVVLVVALALFGALRPLNLLGTRRARELSAAQVRYAGGVGETIRLAEETHVFGVAGAQRARVGTLIDAARELFYRTQVVGRLTPSLYQSAMFLVIIAGVAVLSSHATGHVGSLGGVILVLVRAGSFGQMVQASYQGLRQSLPFIERLQEAERRYRENTPARGELALDRVTDIAFERVSFAYRPERPVLTDVSFTVSAGESIGIIGPSGAGKSTLVQMLLQLRSPGEGRYLVNGQPAGEYAPRDWHRLVAYVPQEPRLLHASVAENIRFLRDIEPDDIQRAARLARIDEDILGWADGYDTVVGPRADAISGGQQQRICLARALAARPEVLVLDEPTSALDPHSETLIQDSLISLKHELTMFIIAHRMSTLDMCDRVMVITDGRLVAFDTIAALRESNAYYRSASTIAAGSGILSSSGSGSCREPPRSREAGDATGSPPRRGRSIAPPGTAAPPPQAPLAGRTPDFFIVGQPKSGTTALYEMLRRHPQVFMPASKEPWFFASELHERTPPRPGGTPQTLAEYLRLFAPAGPEQRVGEATALYLWSKTAAQAIAEVQPAAKIIAILREPASLLRSLHLQFVQTYVETEHDLRSALALEEARRAGREIPRYSFWPQALRYSEHVRYVEQLRRYEAHFGQTQMLVLIYDDFRDDNEATVRRVLRFLEVDDSVDIDVIRANPTVRARSARVHELVHAVSVGRGPISLAVKRAIKAITPTGMRRGALQATQRHVVFSEPPAPDEGHMRELRRQYEPEVRALSEHLGRDLLTLWGYRDGG